MSDDEKPFRIPRKQRQERLSPTKAAGRSSLVHAPGKEKEISQGYGRSSVVHAPGKHKEIPHGYGRPIVPLKRKATSSTEAGPKPRRNRDGSTDSPVETILQSMMQASVPKKPTPKEKEEIADPESPPPPSKFTRRSGPSLLTKEKVERHSSSQECYSFGKKGLMEALLEHKMKTGRIDPHTEIGLCLNYKRSVDPYHPEKMKSTLEKMKSSPPVVASPPRKGPRTPPGTPPSPKKEEPVRVKKGPATPPDSPPFDSSSESRSPSFRGRSEDSESVTDFVNRAEGGATSKSYSVSEKKSEKTRSEDIAPQVSTSGSTSEGNKEVLEKLARMARVDVDHLKNCLKPDVLNTLNQLDSSVLLATVSTVLSTLAQTVSKVGGMPSKAEAHQEVTSSISPKGLPPTAGTSNEAEALVSSTVVKDESVEMDLESENGETNHGQSQKPVKDESWRQSEQAIAADSRSGMAEMPDGQVPVMRVDLCRQPPVPMVPGGQVPLVSETRPPPLPPMPIAPGGLAPPVSETRPPPLPPMPIAPGGLAPPVRETQPPPLPPMPPETLPPIPPEILAQLRAQFPLPPASMALPPTGINISGGVSTSFPQLPTSTTLVSVPVPTLQQPPPPVSSMQLGLPPVVSVSQQAGTGLPPASVGVQSAPSSNPNQVQMIHTLMNALAIPKHPVPGVLPQLPQQQISVSLPQLPQQQIPVSHGGAQFQQQFCVPQFDGQLQQQIPVSHAGVQLQQHVPGSHLGAQLQQQQQIRMAHVGVPLQQQIPFSHMGAQIQQQAPVSHLGAQLQQQNPVSHVEAPLQQQIPVSMPPPGFAAPTIRMDSPRVSFNVPPPSRVNSLVAQIRPEIMCSAPPPPNMSGGNSEFLGRHDDQRAAPGQKGEQEFLRVPQPEPAFHHRHHGEQEFHGRNEDRPEFNNQRNFSSGPPERNFPPRGSHEGLPDFRGPPPGPSEHKFPPRGHEQGRPDFPEPPRLIDDRDRNFTENDMPFYDGPPLSLGPGMQSPSGNTDHQRFSQGPDTFSPGMMEHRGPRFNRPPPPRDERGFHDVRPRHFDRPPMNVERFGHPPPRFERPRFSHRGRSQRVPGQDRRFKFDKRGR